MFKNIAFIGQGSWGKALSCAINQVGKNIFFLPRSLDGITKAEIVFIAIPVNQYLTLSNQLKLLDCSSTNQIFICCSKGIDSSLLLYPHEIINKHSRIKHENIGLLSGPNFAAEIKENLPAKADIAFSNLNLAKNISSELTSSKFKLTPTNNVFGVAYWGAIKNVAAIICGVSQGLELGGNFKSIVLSGLISEMQILFLELNNENDFFLHQSSGFADMYLTTSSAISRNYRFGMSLVRKIIDTSETVEGYGSSLAFLEILNNSKYFKLTKLQYACKLIAGQINLDKKEFVKKFID